MTYGEALRSDTLHEDVHVVLGSVGSPAMFLREGAAEYLSHGNRVHSWCSEAQPWRRGLSLTTLLLDASFERCDPYMSYLVAASFVGFLLRRGGAREFLRLYEAPPGRTEQTLREVYGAGSADLEAEWREFLQHAAWDVTPSDLPAGGDPTRSR